MENKENEKLTKGTDQSLNAANTLGPATGVISPAIDPGSLGARRVRLDYNPFKNGHVHMHKTNVAELINFVDGIEAKDSETARYKAMVITDLERAMDSLDKLF